MVLTTVRGRYNVAVMVCWDAVTNVGGFWPDVTVTVGVEMLVKKVVDVAPTVVVATVTISVVETGVPLVTVSVGRSGARFLISALKTLASAADSVSERRPFKIARVYCRDPARAVGSTAASRNVRPIVNVGSLMTVTGIAVLGLSALLTILA